MSLFARVMLEKKEEVKFKGKAGRWVTINGRHVFILKATGEPLQHIPGLTDKMGGDKKDAEGDIPSGDLKTVGNVLKDKDEMNVATTSVKDLYDFATKMFAKAGTTPEAMIPNFKKNLALLKSKMSQSKGIKRIDMPVVEPKDMKAFKKDLERGAVDVFSPYAKETLKKYGTKLPWQRSSKPLKPGSKEAKKMIGLGLPKHDKGNVDDDIVKGKFGKSKVSQLKPVQDQIWFKKVIGNLMVHGVPKQGGHLTDGAPIIKSSDGYIIDGHHRFAQAVLADPNLKLKSLELPLDTDTLVKVARTYGTAKGNRAKA